MDSIEEFNISSPFEIDEKINEVIENTNDDEVVNLYEEKRAKIKEYLYDVDNWELNDLYVLFDMNPDRDLIDKELFKTKVSPYLAQYDGSSDTALYEFLNQAVNRLSMDRFQLSWDEMNVFRGAIGDNISTKSTGIRIYSIQRNIMTDDIYDFIFQLNEPIHDVISFSLVECTIPLSWFTFSELYKNNSFLMMIAENTDPGRTFIIDQNIRNAFVGVNDDCSPKTVDSVEGESSSDSGNIDKVDYALYETIKIRDGNYTAKELADELNHKIIENFQDKDIGVDDDGEPFIFDLQNGLDDQGNPTYFKIFEYESRTRRFRANKIEGYRLHFVFYSGLQSETKDTQINDCLGKAMGFLAPQHNLKFDSYDMDLKGESDSDDFIRAPYMANTYGTPIINISIDDFATNQIGSSFIDGRPSEYNFERVQEDRFDYIDGEETELSDRYPQTQGEARALQKSQHDILSMKAFPSNVAYSDIFASIPVTRSPCNTDILQDSTPTMIHYSSSELFTFTRNYSGATNISKMRIRLTNSLGKPLYLEQDYFIILKANHLIRTLK